MDASEKFVCFGFTREDVFFFFFFFLVSALLRSLLVASVPPALPRLISLSFLFLENRNARKEKKRNALEFPK